MLSVLLNSAFQVVLILEKRSFVSVQEAVQSLKNTSGRKFEYKFKRVKFSRDNWGEKTNKVIMKSMRS